MDCSVIHKEFDRRYNADTQMTPENSLAAREPSRALDSLQPQPSGLTVSFIFEVDAYRENDPSAGSPTETLLRLLLPLSGKVH